MSCPTPNHMLTAPCSLASRHFRGGSPSDSRSSSGSGNSISISSSDDGNDSGSDSDDVVHTSPSPANVRFTSSFPTFPQRVNPAVEVGLDWLTFARQEKMRCFDWLAAVVSALN